LERYVIHIHRRDPADPRKITGTVEYGGGHGRAGFLHSDALVNILAFPWGLPPDEAEYPENSAPRMEFNPYSQIVRLVRVEPEGP
jgi:hypothetical protein